MELDVMKLTTFLVEAKQATYANKDAPKASPLRPGSEDYHFKQGEWEYHDTYFGGRDFMGEEIVYQNGMRVWGMNYYGYLLTEEVSPKDAYAVLRPALMQLTGGGVLPVRGPKEYVEGNSKYLNTQTGQIERFSGTEEITLNNEKVYQGWYHGGLIR